LASSHQDSFAAVIGVERERRERKERMIALVPTGTFHEPNSITVILSGQLFNVLFTFTRVR
jgi:hypothetical protein